MPGECRHKLICKLDARHMVGGPDDDLCILHSHDPDKPKDAFNSFLQTHQEERGHDYQDFVFPERISFTGTQFPRGANFKRVKFLGDVDFGGVHFEGLVFFSDAKFRGEARFEFTQFPKGVSFNRAAFRRAVLFAGQGPAEDERLFAGGGLEVDFSDARFEVPSDVRFRNVDFSRCRLYGTDLREVHIVNGYWPEVEQRCIFRARIGVYDEIMLQTKAKQLKAQGEKVAPEEWEHVEDLYRQLKVNYEQEKNFQRAGVFHFGEKEARRKSLSPWKQPLWWMLSGYLLIGGYGERASRPLGWWFVLVTIGTLVFLGAELVPKDICHGVPLLWDCSVFSEAFLYSVQVAAFQRPQYYALILWSRLVYVVLSLLGPVLLGLFALAVRQNLKR